MKRIPLRVAISDFWTPPEKAIQSHLFRLLSKRFQLELDDRADVLIYSCFGERFHKFDGLRIFYTGENKRPDFHECDYAFSFDYPTSKRNYRLPLYRLHPGFEELLAPRDVASVMSGKTEFCNFVYSNPAPGERDEFFRLLSEYKPVLSGGRHLNNIGGPVIDKFAFMRPCKFSIAFENSSYPGYTTEKILHAFETGTVPIYWGNPEVARDFNPQAFINCHEFPDFASVVEQVKQIDQDDERFRHLLAQPALLDNRVPGELTDEAILDRFQTILENPTRQRTAATALSYKLAQINKRVRRQIKRSGRRLLGRSR